MRGFGPVQIGVEDFNIELAVVVETVFPGSVNVGSYGAPDWTAVVAADVEVDAVLEAAAADTEAEKLCKPEISLAMVANVEVDTTVSDVEAKLTNVEPGSVVAAECAITDFA